MILPLGAASPDTGYPFPYLYGVGYGYGGESCADKPHRSPLQRVRRLEIRCL